MKTLHGPSPIGALVWAAITTIPTVIGAALPPHVEGELLVQFRGGPRGEAATRAQAAMKHEVKHHFDFIGWQHLRLPEGATVEEGLARYRNHPDVLAVEPNAIREHASGAADPYTDPLLHQQWNLERVGAAYAWAATNAVTNVVVAIIDTGVNYLHEDLSDSMWRNPGEIPGNRIDDDGNGYVDDVYGIDTANDAFGNDADPLDQGVNVSPGGLRIFHGTACAGIVAAAHNGVGVAGIGTSVKIMALRTLQVGDTIAVADTMEAFNYLILMKRRGVNVRVTSMSYGGGGYFQAEKDAHDAVAREGILQVNGVHNNKLNLDVTASYPASYSVSNFLKVAASEGLDNLASFSNYGRNTVHLAAPGVAILSTHAPGTNDYTFSFNGTSSACPLAAGAAALLWSRFPEATVDQIIQSMLESVDVLPALTNRVITGGRLNVARAMSRFLSNTPPVFISQPQTDSVPGGSPATLRASVAGSAPLSYEWRFNGTNLPNATQPVLSWPGVSTNEAGSYGLIASNPFGAITSAVVTLTVAPEPATFTRITSGTIATTSANSVSAAWADYNNDGWLDLFVATALTEGPDFLYRNDSNSTFTAVTSGGVGTDLGDSWSSAWGDYDNDGDPDLFVANGGNVGSANDFLYRNDGGAFRRITNSIGSLPTDGGASLDPLWADFDNDGWLDLYVSNGRLDGGRTNFLYHNNANGTFTRVTNGLPVTDAGRYFGVAAADYDNDGFTDLFAANGAGLPSALYHNNGDGTFSRSTALGPLTGAFTPSAAWGDYDNDGDLDLVVGRYNHSLLFRNEGRGEFTRVGGPPVDDVTEAISVTWADYDNDGFLDLLVTSESGVGRLYHNSGDGLFRRVSTGTVATEGGGSITAAWGDFDNNGFQDLFVCKLGVPNSLYHNDGNSNRWLRVKCRGTVSNCGGVGAKVRVKTVVAGIERWQMREIAKGHSFGQSELVASFGLGNASGVEVLRIEWPSGIVQELHGITPNQTVILDEPGLRIVQQPQQLNVQLGRNATNVVRALSDRPLTYQWLLNATSLAGQTSATLILTNVQIAQEGDYSVIVNDGLRSSTSAVGRLTVLITPTFVQAPVNQTVVAGGELTVSASITGRPTPFTYSWRRASPAAILTNSVSDAPVNFVTLNTTAAGLVLADNMLATNIICRLVVSNAAVSGLGLAQPFTVTVLADADHNGLPDAWELAYGLTAADADADADGVSNRDEYASGTNPTNSLDYLRVIRVERADGNPGGVTLEFMAMSNLTYTVERTDQLTPGAWSKFADIVARAANRVEVLVDPSAGPRRYYRLVTPRQP